MSTHDVERPAEASRFQAPERWVWRSEIRNAPYNPRKIGPVERKRLERSIKRAKLLGALAVNERTEKLGFASGECGLFLVSGHQRLTALDALEGKGKDDYKLLVAVTRLDPKAEREQNLVMNSAGAQGDWDLGMLPAVFEGIDADAAGFDPITLEDYGILQSDLTDQAAESLEAVAMVADVAAIVEHKRDTAAEARARKAEYRAQERGKDAGTEHYAYLLFPDTAAKERFLEVLAAAVGPQPDKRYLNGPNVTRALEAAMESSNA